MPFDLSGSSSRNMSYWYLEMFTKKYVTWIFTVVLFVIEKERITTVSTNTVEY